MRDALKAKFFKGLADPSRLAILEALGKGPRCVNELSTRTGLPQSNLSMHLACLRDCGLVRARREGRFVYYRLADPAIGRLLSEARSVLRKVAGQIGSCPRYEAGEKNNGNKNRPSARLRV